MITKEYAIKLVNRLKADVQKSIKKEKYENALDYIAICANILYTTNIYYMDDDLEDAIGIISKNIVKTENKYDADKNVIIFYDGFGLNYRGLVRQYLNALCQYKKVVYVTYENRKNEIPDIIKLLNEYCTEIYFLKNASNIEKIKELNNVIRSHKPSHFFFYSIPADVIGTTIMAAYDNRLMRHQVNLTDHAFWLSAKCIDRCLEFRDYGANISLEYRKIPKEKLIAMPYYPVIDKSVKFRGFPFEIDKTKNKVVFSGGALYKTIDNSNAYYKIIDDILKKHKEVIFWYAGTGDDSKIKLLIAKYPNRVYHTPERPDIFQIIENCTIYLNTYPVVGALMMQLAASAGKVPITLKHGTDGSGILLNQNKQKIEFDNIEELKNEISKLLQDDEYLKTRSLEIQKTVISENCFNENIKKLLAGEISPYNFLVEHQDTEKFRNDYLKRVTKKSLSQFFVKKNVCVILHYPVMFMIGFIYRVLSKVKRTIIK